MKMKILVVVFALSAFLLCRILSLSKLLLIIALPGGFLVVTTLLNKYRYKRAYYNDFPNAFRVFLGVLGGVLIDFFPSPTLVGLGLLAIIAGLLANDEAMRRVYRGRGVIALSGIDGTGKSTHVRNIYRWLRRRGVRCRIIPFHRYLFLDKVGGFRSRVRGTAELMKRMDRRPPGWVPARTSRLSIIRPYLALVDNILLYLTRVVPAIWRGEYVVCDRFIWDNYVKHKMLGYGTRYLFQLSTIIKPKAGMIFDLPSEVAVKRVGKRDFHYQYTKEQYDVERREFRRIAKKLGYPVINTDRPMEETWREIEAYLTKLEKQGWK